MSHNYPQVYVHIAVATVQISVLNKGKLERQFEQPIASRTDALTVATQYINDVMAKVQAAHPGGRIPWKLLVDDETLFKAYYRQMEIPEDRKIQWGAIRELCHDFSVSVVYVRNIPTFQARSAAPEPPKQRPEPVKRIIFHEPKRPEVIEFRNIPTEAELPQPVAEQMLLFA